MSKSILAVLALATAASIVNAHDLVEPLLKTSLRRDATDSRSARAASLQQIDEKNYDSNAEVLDSDVAGGSMAYLAKGPSIMNTPVVQEQIEQAEEEAMEKIEAKVDLKHDIVEKIVHDVEEEMMLHPDLSPKKLVANIEAEDPALAKIDHDEIVKAVDIVMAVAKKEEGEIEAAMEEAEDMCPGQERFDIMMCDSHMCTKCVLAQCMEYCQETQKMFPTCRCKDWPKSRKSYSGGEFAGKGKFGDAGDYSKEEVSGRFMQLPTKKTSFAKAAAAFISTEIESE